MKLYLVRHGETIYNAAKTFQPEDSPLSSLGLKQAEFLAIRLKNIPIDVFTASPLTRTRQTAEIINKELNKEIIWTDLLKEMRRPSEFIGKKTNSEELTPVKKMIEANADDKNWHYSDEENFIDLKERAIKMIAFMETLRVENILAVSHGEFSRLTMAVMMLGDTITYAEYKRVHDFLKTINTGITVFEKMDDKWKLLTWNDHSHLG